MTNQAKEEFWRERIAHWRESGLSQRAYALQHGHPVRQFGYWVRRLSAAPSSTAEFVPVVIKSAPVAPALVLRSPQGWSVEIPAGAAATWLGDLLRSL